MKMLKILITAIFVSLFLIMPSMVSANNLNDLKVTVETDKPQYRWLFDTVGITLTLTNMGNESANISFPTSQYFDFEITDQKITRLVYIWSYHKTFQQIITDVTIAPGASMSWQLTWNKHQNIRLFPVIFPIFPGTYTVTGIVMATGIFVHHAETNITIGSVITPTIPT